MHSSHRDSPAMQNNFTYPYTSGDLWRKRPHPSRVDDYDSDDSSTTGSPWRAMKRLRVGERDAPPEPEQSQLAPDLERVVSHSESTTSTNDEDYANFNKLLGALHLERRNREMVRTTPRKPTSTSLVYQVSQAPKAASPMIMTPPDKGRTRRKQTKLKTSSKLA